MQGRPTEQPRCMSWMPMAQMLHTPLRLVYGELRPWAMPSVRITLPPIKATLEQASDMYFSQAHNAAERASIRADYGRALKLRPLPSRSGADR